MRIVLISALLVGFMGACGGHSPPPKRGVVEGDLDGWKFRRFQGPLLDVEVWIEGNKGIAHSASYITEESEKRGQIDPKDLVNVTVTKYERDEGIVRETVRFVRRLAAEKGYQVEEEKIKGVRLLEVTGPGEAWVMWPAKNYVVKIGGQGRTDVPKALISDYGDRFESKLPGGSLEGPLPAGPDSAPKKTDEKTPYDANNPQPDMDHYDPNKVKLPGDKNDDAPPPDTKIDTSADHDDDDKKTDDKKDDDADKKPVKKKKKRK
ncbi:MAG TPA: hypothetical protein VGM39_13475 [Kofleriaceae bacterium]|jgi:hypothetical protein